MLKKQKDRVGIKRKGALILAAALVFTLFSACSQGAGDASGSGTSQQSAGGSASGSGEIKIGVVGPLTGAVSTYGQSAQKGLKLLAKQVNAKGGIDGKQISFIFTDDENKPATAVTAGQKLIFDDKVCAIVGPMTSTCANSLAPICQTNQIPMISPYATNPKVTQAGDYIFRTCFIDPFQGTVLAKFSTSNLKAKSAAVLFDNGNDYSKGLAEFFIDGFKKLGGNVVDTETYNTGDKDFNTQLTKIAQKNPDVLVLPDFYSTVAVVMKEARTAGIKATFLGGDGWDSADLFTIAGSNVEGAYFSNHYSPDDTSQSVVQFIKDFKAEYSGDTPDAIAALSYDSGQIVVKAIQSAGKTDSQSIRDAIKKTNGSFVTGSIQFDENRNPTKAAVILKCTGGKSKFFTKVNP
ncbi:MAG: ABC transporter substrate-binding protein [Oscillospiraceae bacterium]|jgi:branched-chain amino acid transport system substrate-binding protein|nr:ABC transporter substrate-binding protein [Oscillospiraceae bacterium]MCI1990450.1 ABC transporter substrate-binding protein [Oscillospiraceae bacterium]MCI2035788.1 ABC transporter substrate-binding protein [Oscillospiraceae bacterium]